MKLKTKKNLLVGYGIICIVVGLFINTDANASSDTFNNRLGLELATGAVWGGNYTYPYINNVEF